MEDVAVAITLRHASLTLHAASTVLTARHSPFAMHRSFPDTMRAEIEHLVDEAKQSIALLRRHL